MTSDLDARIREQLEDPKRYLENGIEPLIDALTAILDIGGDHTARVIADKLGIEREETAEERLVRENCEHDFGPRPDHYPEIHCRKCTVIIGGYGPSPRFEDAAPQQCDHARRITIGGKCAECACGNHQPQRPPADMMMPPEEWCRSYGVHIHDADGWRGNDVRGWDEPVTLVEFERRALRSTVDVANPAWIGVSRDARQCEQDERGRREVA